MTPRLATSLVINKRVEKEVLIQMCVICYGAKDGTYRLNEKGIGSPYCKFCKKCESFERVEEASSTLTARVVTKLVKKGPYAIAYFG